MSAQTQSARISILAVLAMCPAFMAQPAWGMTATVEILFGVLKDAGGANPVSDGALWITVYDQNNDGVFPGGLATNGTLSDPAAARAAFGGRTLAAGDLIEGDRIIRFGPIDTTANGPGIHQSVVQPNPLNLTTEDLVPGRKWAFYWFPDLTTANTSVPTGGFEVGGINEVANNDPLGVGQGPMTIPSGGVWTIAVYDSTLNGTLPPSRFHAITAAPYDYQAWINGYYPGESDPAKIGFTADPDCDGLENGVEAILASAPDAPSTGISLVSAGAGSVVVSSHSSKAIPSDITAVWQWSTNLNDWRLSGESEGPLTVAISHLITDGSHPDYDVIETTVAASSGGAPKLFCRLGAVQSP